jgi:hypothetical protein
MKSIATINTKKIVIPVAAITFGILLIFSISISLNTAYAQQNNRNNCDRNVVGVCAGVNADVLRNGQVCVGVLQYTASCQR